MAAPIDEDFVLRQKGQGGLAVGGQKGFDFLGLEAHHIWLAILLGHFTRATLSVLRFRQGDWRNIEVQVS
jgi:Na+-driven multidrug efflux pump